jgi:hypothetical protein
MSSAIDLLLMESVDKFFENKEYFQLMYDIITHNDKDGISLRLLEFMFTKFSKRYEIVIIVNSFPVRLYDIYNQGLQMYGKAHYDCFKRHQRVVFHKHGQELETTIGQMTFFRHIIPTGSLDFARMYLAELKAEMASYSKGGIAPIPKTSSRIGSITQLSNFTIQI